MFQMDGGEDVPSEEEDEENGPDERQDQDSDDDGGGWITPSNIKQIQQEMKQCAVPRDVRVGCVTTDFAMQVGGVGICWPGLSVTSYGQWSLGGWGWDVRNCYIMLLFLVLETCLCSLVICRFAWRLGNHIDKMYV